MNDSSCSWDTCCDRGLLNQGDCMCDYGFFGDHCDQQISKIFTPQYYIFIGLYCLVFLYTLINASYQLYNKIFDKNLTIQEKSQISIKLLVASPINIILTLSCLFSLVKLIWLILDPLQLYKGKTIIIEHILHDIAYTLLFYIYGYLLITWYSMYAEICFYLSNQDQNDNYFNKESNNWICQHYKKVVKLRLFLVLLVQTAVSIFTGLRLEIKYPHFAVTCYSFLLINFIIFIFEFALYGIKLQRCIRYQLNQFYNEKKKKILNLMNMKEELQKQLEQKQTDAQFQSSFQIKKVENSPSQNSSRRPSVDLPQVLVPNQKERLRKKNVTFCKNNSSFMYYRQESHHNIKVNQNIKEVIAEQTENSERETNIIQNINESCCLEESIKQIDWIYDQQDKQIIENVIQKKNQVVRDAKEKISGDQVNIIVPQKQNNRKQVDISNLSDQSQDQTQYTQIGQQIDAFEQQKYLEEQQLSLKSSSLEADKKILQKIMLLVSLGITYEVIFGIMCIIALVSEAIYSTPIGTMVYYYVSSTLQFLSLFNVLKLFKDFRSQQIKNFIWIQKIGNKKSDLNQNYSFIIPQEYKQDDDMLRKFESRINLITLY
ncbi:unnamed protein product [Paramecium pentaurelia]|uniref:Uncharacterized protein n=1 Tax=Paramecium pentaurelia TaxID=43138 RepID=A0A8S1TRL2_9CILI|nr:unnamed protein product [Paramecium pentaurelia]